MLPVTRRLLLPLAVTAAVLLAGCGGASTSGEADGERVVVASFYPLAWVSERVAGQRFDVVNLTSAGGEPHDLQLGIGQTADIEAADVLVVEDGFQPAVDEAVANVGTGTVVDVADVTDLLATGESEEEHDHEGGDHEGGDHEGHEGHDHGDTDPHFWHDPLRMADVGDAVADALGEADPDRAAEYAERAEALRADLTALDTEFADGLADCDRDHVVVSHDAFSYLAKYGLHLESIVGLSPDAEPSPATLARLQEVIGEEGITTVFAERLASPAMAESLAGDLSISTDVLDPIEGLTDETAEEDYLSLMHSNLEALQKANGCRT